MSNTTAQWKFYKNQPLPATLDGRAFLVEDSDETANTVIDYRITTSDLVVEVLLSEVYFDMADITVEWFEDSDLSGGTAVEGISAINRNIPLPGTTVVTKGPTVTDVGTRFRCRKYYGEAGKGSKADVTLVNSSIPLVLKPNTNYLVRITKGAAGNISLSFSGTFSRTSD